MPISMAFAGFFVARRQTVETPTEMSGRVLVFNQSKAPAMACAVLTWL
jgi:hypothetical protein